MRVSILLVFAERLRAVENYDHLSLEHSAMGWAAQLMESVGLKMIAGIPCFDGQDGRKMHIYSAMAAAFDLTWCQSYWVFGPDRYGKPGSMVTAKNVADRIHNFVLEVGTAECEIEGTLDSQDLALDLAV